jgi:FMN phosphatase YigB (HAD superfamily)
MAARGMRDLVPFRQFPRVLRTVMPAVRNNSTASTNYDHFVSLLVAETGSDRATVDARFRHMSRVEFPKLRRCFYPLPPAQETVARLAAQARRQVIATNPLWPECTVADRLAWAGLDSEQFSFITSGENMSRSKPSVSYYEELVRRLEVSPADCVMIGNDAGNDAPAAHLGIPVFLLLPRRRRGVALDPLVPAGLVRVGGWAELQTWLGLTPAASAS